jgi:hypothetical protein
MHWPVGVRNHIDHLNPAKSLQHEEYNPAVSAQREFQAPFVCRLLISPRKAEIIALGFGAATQK